MFFSKKNLGFALLVCAVALPALPAKADIAAIKNSNSEIWGSVGTQLLNYVETVDGQQFDSEHGWNPSLEAGISYMSPKSNWYTSLDFSDTFGTVHYNGGIQFGNGVNVPFQDTSMTNIINVDAKFGKGIAVGRYFMFTPYADLGYRHWGRKVESAVYQNTLIDQPSENYHNFDLLGGLMVQAAPTNRLILTGYASLGPTIGSEMQTDGFTYNLGSSMMYKVGAKIGFDLTKRVELFTSLDYDAFRFVQSQTVGDGSLEPNSKTEDTTVRVGIGYHFR